MADTGNHCIRRITVRQANVDTVAGVCGSPGYADGLFSVNKMNRPSMIGMDRLGNMFIFDSGNKKIRMMVRDTGEVFTLLDGACREDKMMPQLDVPFGVNIRGMLCYKRWLTTEPTEDFNVYPEADVEAAEMDNASGEDGEEEEVAKVDVFKTDCLTTHPVLCETASPHPLVRERRLDTYHW